MVAQALAKWPSEGQVNDWNVRQRENPSNFVRHKAVWGLLGSARVGDKFSIDSGAERDPGAMQSKRLGR